MSAGEEVAGLAAVNAADEGFLVVEAAQEQQLFAERLQRIEHLAQLHAAPSPLAHHSLLMEAIAAKRGRQTARAARKTVYAACHRPTRAPTPAKAKPSSHQCLRREGTSR